MRNFTSEFQRLTSFIDESKSILLFAHSHPDMDTIGATFALSLYLEQCGKKIETICFDPFPSTLQRLLPGHFLHPEQVSFEQCDLLIACDSVDRGFDRIRPTLQGGQKTVSIDHHPHIKIKSDVNIIDTRYSSTCEILFDYFEYRQVNITKMMATALLAGIIFDTGNFQHICTTPRVMEIAGILMKKGAPLTKIVNAIFSNTGISALRLWGRAFEQSVFNTRTHTLVAAITQQDVKECQASVEDIYQVTSILSNVPEAKIAIVLSERDDNTVRASIRSMEHHHVDVSAIARQFGGGGHRLSSGFELPGKLQKTTAGWIVI